MKSLTVYQIPVLNKIMKEQFNVMDGNTCTILGIAGGNGLEHIDPHQYSCIYGVDINASYLDACLDRFPNLKGILKCQCLDVTTDAGQLSKTDHLIANLFLEYIDQSVWEEILIHTQPKTVSCVIQINPTNTFVSDSSNCAVFDVLESIVHPMHEEELCACMSHKNFSLCYKEQIPLPNGKYFLRLDFIHAIG